MYRKLSISVVALVISMFSMRALANEVLQDRCSGDVAIVPSYDARPDSPGTITLTRDANGQTNWTSPFKVGLSDAGRIRWWCHSTTGNQFDIGTWRIEEIFLGTSCDVDANFQPENCKAKPNIKFGSSAWNGWTSERSRCDNRTSLLRARLGPDRSLEMECLDPNASVGVYALSIDPPSTPSTCYDTVPGHIAWDYYGSSVWDAANVDRLCTGAESSREPAWCFLHVMHGGVDWGGGTWWDWWNALDLCEGTQDAAGTISCFKTQIAGGSMWPDAIAACQVR